MRKLALFTGSMLVVMLALAGGFSVPRAAWGVCRCETNNDYLTTIHWGTGGNCTDAHNSLVQQVNQEAFDDCGGATKTCLGSLVITSPCPNPSTGGIIEDGQRYYSCKVCGPITP